MHRMGLRSAEAVARPGMPLEKPLSFLFAHLASQSLLVSVGNDLRVRRGRALVFTYSR